MEKGGSDPPRNGTGDGAVAERVQVPVFVFVFGSVRQHVSNCICGHAIRARQAEVAELTTALERLRYPPSTTAGASEVDDIEAKLSAPTALEREHVRLRKEYDRVRKKAIELEEEVHTLRGLVGDGTGAGQDQGNVISRGVLDF
jgi:hypothetical protein